MISMAYGVKGVDWLQDIDLYIHPTVTHTHTHTHTYMHTLTKEWIGYPIVTHVHTHTHMQGGGLAARY